MTPVEQMSAQAAAGQRRVEQHVEQLRDVAARVGGTVSLCGDELVVEIPEERRKEFDLLLRSLKL